MPNIVLKEQDLTTVAIANDSTDVVFIPGIADTNFNCYICNVPDVDPKTAGDKELRLAPSKFAKGDTIHHKNGNNPYKGAPSIFVNTFDKKAWKYTGNTVDEEHGYESKYWEAIEYATLAPLNQPTYINSMSAFNANFGSKAYKWSAANYEEVEGKAIADVVDFESGVTRIDTNNFVGEDGADGLLLDETKEPVAHVTINANGIIDFVDAQFETVEDVLAFTSGTTSVMHTPVVAGTIKLLDVNDEQVDDADGEHPATADTDGVITQTSFKDGKSAADVVKIEYVYQVLDYADKATFVEYAYALDFNDARVLPKFAVNELPGDADAPHYFYNEGDIEKSYLYAKELLNAGLPIFFEDVCVLANANEALGDAIEVFVKTLPYVRNIYDAMANTLTGKPNEVGYDGTHGVFTNYELFDIGEYNFKYVTSGGYPVFNVISNVRQINTIEKVDGFVSGATEVAHEPVEGGDIFLLNVDGEVIGDGRANGEIIDASYIDPETTDADVKAVQYTYEVGGEPTTIVDNMMRLCTTRGDCYTLIDHADNVLRPWYGEKSLFKAVQDAGFGDMGSRAGMFTPWATYKMDTMTLTTLMPASFGYLRTIAVGIRTYNNYFAYAGVNRGEVYGIKELHCMYPLTNTVANDLQTKSGYSINPITYIKPYGLTIWGNRTLLEAEDGLKATNFLNIRNLICEIQKTAYNAAKVCLFENDTLGTWVKFTNPINNLLKSMQNAGALRSFAVNRVPTTAKAVINAEIRIVPTYAVEEFEITVILLDDGEVTVAT